MPHHFSCLFVFSVGLMVYVGRQQHSMFHDVTHYFHEYQVVLIFCFAQVIRFTRSHTPRYVFPFGLGGLRCVWLGFSPWDVA